MAPDGRIDPDSLTATLEAHRDSNLSSLIRKPKLIHSREQTNKQASKEQLGGPDYPSPELPQAVNLSKRGRRTATSGPISYVGENISPRGEWELHHGPGSNHMAVPWLHHIYGPRSYYIHDRLTAEIMAFEKYIEPRHTEKKAVEETFSAVQRVIASVNSVIKSYKIGSQASGLAMPLSDIDINIDAGALIPCREPGIRGPSPSRPQAKKKREAILRSITHALKKKGGPKPAFEDVCFVDAMVPIVRARHKITQLDIQIQCTRDGLSSLELVKTYIQEFPTLRPLFLVLRQMIKMRGLGEPSAHGLGSYSLVMMIVVTLKLSGPRFDRADAGRQFLFFLDFWSRIDLTKSGVSVEPPEIFSKVSEPSTSAVARRPSSSNTSPISLQSEVGNSEDDTGDDWRTRILSNSVRRHAGPRTSPIYTHNAQRPYLMILVDPVSPLNNLGHSANAIKHIQTTFFEVRKQISEIMAKVEHGKGPVSQASLLGPCLKGNYRSFEQKRRQLEEATQPKDRSENRSWNRSS